MSSQHDSNRQQFEARSAAYLTSTVHASGPDLRYVTERLQKLSPSGKALDAGCGAGHLAFTLAPHCTSVVATDPLGSMLLTVAAEAAKRGHENIITTQCAAAPLPFPDAQYDLYATRYSAHHWPDVPQALAEARRVLKAGAELLVIDVLGGDTPLADTHLQCWELLRDPSHVRDYSDADWRQMLEVAGFSLEAGVRFPLRIEYLAWIERMATPPERSQLIRQLQQAASAEVAAALKLEPDGSFEVSTGVYFARRA